MDEGFNPADFLFGLILRGIFLGVILAIAWPVKKGIDFGTKFLYLKGRDATRKTVRLIVKNKEILETQTT